MRTITTLFVLLLLLVITQKTNAQTNWWDAKWFYRLPISVQPIKGEVRDAQARVQINFTTALKANNLRAALDTTSMRVVEINEAGQVIDDQVTFQFTPDRDFHPSKKAQGTLSLKLKGKTGEPRNFQLYFDTTNSDKADIVQPLRMISSIHNSQSLEQTSLYVKLSGIESRVVTSATRMRSVESVVALPNPDVSDLSSAPNYLNKPEHRFFAGYCTYYAAKKWKEFTGTPVTWNGDAGRWYDHAAEEGRTVSSDPHAAVRGAVIVWTRAGHAGHVAFVEEVSADGIRITEMNAHGLWVVSDAFLPFTNLDKGTKYKFKGYVLPE